MISSMERFDKVVAEAQPDLEDWLVDVQQTDYFDMDVDPEELFIEVRVRYENGGVYFHSGDPSYDQTHCGFWGYGILTPDTDTDELAEEMISDMRDSFYQHCSEVISRAEKNRLDWLENGDQKHDEEVLDE